MHSPKTGGDDYEEDDEDERADAGVSRQAEGGRPTRFLKTSRKWFGLK
jgi:hypothetical protein